MKHAAVVYVPHPFRSGYFLTIDHPDRGVEAPGGKLESGEMPREAAIREVAEETGYLVRRLHRLCAGPVAPGPDGIAYHVTCFSAEAYRNRVGPGEARLRPGWRHARAFRPNLPTVCRHALHALYQPEAVS